VQDPDDLERTRREPYSGDQRRYSASNMNTHFAVQEVRQLPSPSPSPSPRSLSPSFATTESFADSTGARSSISNGHGYSGSLEKPLHSKSAGDDEAILSPLPISKSLSVHELHNIPEERVRRPRKLSSTKINGEPLKLSAAEMEELTSAPDSLPITSPARLSFSRQASLAAVPVLERKGSVSDASPSDSEIRIGQTHKTSTPEPLQAVLDANVDRQVRAEVSNSLNRRPGFSSRAISTPPTSSNRMSSYTKASSGQTSPKRKAASSGARPEPLDLNYSTSKQSNNPQKVIGPDPPSPIPQSIPLPPMSIPTYLQLELASTRPSPLYIYRTASSEYPYESSRVKFERLLNFLILPPQLEQVLFFGSLACLDAWLYTFTILPLRFLKAATILIHWWGQALSKEARFISGFIYHGSGRMWHRQRERRGSTDSSSRSRSVSQIRRPGASTTSSYQSQLGRTPEVNHQNGNVDQLKVELERKGRSGWGRRHRRTKSQPSSLSSYHKADLLQGAMIVCSCILLMKLDASRMYHYIRGQSAIKLYVIYNVLEVCYIPYFSRLADIMQVLDKLLAALGQDILECLFSNETLERDTDGRSKILRPLGMFFLALIYNIAHSTALFCQVVSLNVAVNSYSNALITLLMSNQFVEIKSTVFKKIEKDNLFQMTCADVVERFQLWLMIMIISLRNIVEMGGLNIFSTASDGGAADMLREATAPLQSNSILPDSFTILPSWAGEILSPFLIVLGSEMVVDWLKHSYISKFNNVKPAVYQRYLDVLAKDYYTNVRKVLRHN
jgi:hypothetical protein